MLFYFIKFIKPTGFDIHIIRHEKLTPDADCCFHIVAYLDSLPCICMRHDTLLCETQIGTSDDPSYRD